MSQFPEQDLRSNVSPSWSVQNTTSLGLPIKPTPWPKLPPSQALPSPPSQSFFQDSPRRNEYSRSTWRAAEEPMNARPWHTPPVPQALSSPPLEGFLDSQRKNEYSRSWRAAEEPIQARPWPRSPVPQALPSPPLEGFLDAPRKNENNRCWRAAEGQGFSNPWLLGFGDAEASGSEIQAALSLRSPSTDTCGNQCGKHFPLKLESSSSCSVTHGSPGGHMDLPCRAPDDGDVKKIIEAPSGGGWENTGDGPWDGVVNLVQELTRRFTESNCNGNTRTENVRQNPEKTREQLNPEAGCSPQTLQGLESSNKCPCFSGLSQDEIMLILSGIQLNVEKIKAAVPNIASQKHKFTVFVQRECVAALGVVKLISQLADVVSTIVPEIQSQLDAVPSESSPCPDSNNDRKNENVPIAPIPQVSSVQREGGIGQCAGMDRLMPTLAAVSISPVLTMSTNPVREESNGTAQDNKSAVSGASDLGRLSETECASSLVADLLGPFDRITGADGFLPQATISSNPFRLHQWGNDLEEAIRADRFSQLRLETLPFENPNDQLTSGKTGVSDENPSKGGTTFEESDEGDTKGSDQFPLGAFTLMEIDDLEILTEQTHYCNICSKGFKRDANLRMHMRSHGGKYKSSAALVRSEKAPKVDQEMVGGKPTRYSCPYEGCHRNLKHPKFQALKTMLCLKNHYRRSHCAKTLICSICKRKQFSVVADLKTHEKHCGSDKWACSCGTTFSRKEKLYGHVSLFVGHVPVEVSTAASVASETGTCAVPVQLQQSGQLINEKDASEAQNGALNIWQGW